MNPWQGKFSVKMRMKWMIELLDSRIFLFFFFFLCFVDVYTSVCVRFHLVFGR
jgi:hypothetical protein